MLYAVLERPSGSRYVKLIAEEGTLLWDQGSGQVRLFAASRNSWETFPTPPQGYSYEENYFREISSFIGAMQGRENYLTDIFEEHKVVRALEAIQASSNTGRHVSLA